MFLLAFSSLVWILLQRFGLLRCLGLTPAPRFWRRLRLSRARNLRSLCTLGTCLLSWLLLSFGSLGSSFGQPCFCLLCWCVSSFLGFPTTLLWWSGWYHRCFLHQLPHQFRSCCNLPPCLYYPSAWTCKLIWSPYKAALWFVKQQQVPKVQILRVPQPASATPQGHVDHLWPQASSAWSIQKLDLLLETLDQGHHLGKPDDDVPHLQDQWSPKYLICWMQLAESQKSK